MGMCIEDFRREGGAGITRVVFRDWWLILEFILIDQLQPGVAFADARALWKADKTPSEAAELIMQSRDRSAKPAEGELERAFGGDPEPGLCAKLAEAAQAQPIGPADGKALDQVGTRYATLSWDPATKVYEMVVREGSGAYVGRTIWSDVDKAVAWATGQCGVDRSRIKVL